MTLWPATENPVKCADAGHPGVTYDPTNRITWCLCGDRTYLGRSKTVDEHIACCGGPLDRFKEKPMVENPVIDAARKAVGLDQQSILTEVEGLLKSGMPDAVVVGFMKAKVDDLADRLAEAQWAEASRIVDELGQTVHQGDPIKKARVERFNEMFLAALRRRQGESS